MCEFLNIRDVDSGNLSEYWDGGCWSTRMSEYWGDGGCRSTGVTEDVGSTRMMDDVWAMMVTALSWDGRLSLSCCCSPEVTDDVVIMFSLSWNNGGCLSVLAVSRWR